MNPSYLPVYEFEDFRIETGKRVLLRGGEAVTLTARVFDTLLHLVQQRGKVVEKNELMQAVWPNTVVEENNLNQNISALRRALGESRGENRYIATVSGKGYRFVPDVAIVQEVPEENPTRVRLAVLPFENLTGDPEREYLADGLTEETIASIGQIDPDHFSIIGRTSVMAYKRTTKSLAQIGRELAVSYLVESSIRAEVGRVRITCKLIRVREQTQVWSSSYESESSSMLAFQQELSASVAEQIRLRLSPQRMAALLRRQTQNAEAYDLYLRGRHFWNQLTPATTRRAIECYVAATKLDSKYALAWSGLADAYSAAPINGDASAVNLWPLGHDAAAHALDAEPNLAEALTSMGFVKFWLDWDWTAAVAAFEQAILLDPNYSVAYRFLGIVLSHLGRHEEARPASRRCRELDPLYAVNHALSAQVAFAARDFASATAFARHAIVVDSVFWIGHLQLAQACEQTGNSAAAFAALDDAVRLSGGNSKALALRGYLYAKLGKVDQAHHVLNTLEARARERFVPPYATALIHAGLCSYDLAMEHLEAAYEVHDVHLAFLTIDPKWDPLRPTSRFRALLERCHFNTQSMSA
jgi:DNA-binding winged helix-turn-helix (wHTH) protein/Flp pilus assembly protein TadD